MSRIWKLDFRLWTEAKDSPQPNSRRSSPCLRQVLSQAFGSSGPVHRCGLKCLNTAFPRPLGRKWANEWLHRTRIVRSNRGASQQQQPHKSNSSGRVKPLTPLLARKKRKSSLMSLPFLVHTGCETREVNVTQSYATKAVLWSSPQDFAFQQKPWSFAT